MSKPSTYTVNIVHCYPVRYNGEHAIQAANMREAFAKAKQMVRENGITGGLLGYVEVYGKDREKARLVRILNAQNPPTKRPATTLADLDREYPWPAGF